MHRRCRGGANLGQLPGARGRRPSVAGRQQRNTRFTQWARRSKDGIEYRDDSINVILSADSGRLKGLSANFHAAPPKPVTATVTAGHALETARQVFASLNLAASGKPSAPVEMIVQSNGFPKKSTSLDAKPGPSRYAWVCVFPIDRGRVEIWVDASTGTVVGGETAVLA